MSKKSDNKCGPGEILKVGFKRRGFERRPFVRKDGTRVASSYIPEHRVGPTCIKDVGKPGKGPKILPTPDDLVHLSKYGYSVHKPDADRRAALKAASKDNDTLLVLRRLNLLRNYQAVPENKEIFSRDVEYMSKLYSKTKLNERSWRKELKKQNQRKNKRQRGGQIEDPLTPILDEISETSDVVVNNIDLPEKKTVELNTITDEEEICDANGKCRVRNVVYESHMVNSMEVVYYTLTEKDTDEILELDKLYYDSDLTREKVIKKIRDNPGLLIGIKVNDRLQGYCHYEPIGNLQVKIVWFCANKGYGTPLYLFMEKYFQRNNYQRVIIVVSLEGSYGLTRLNFWYAMGFVADAILPEEKKVKMHKDI